MRFSYRFGLVLLTAVGMLTLALVTFYVATFFNWNISTEKLFRLYSGLDRIQLIAFFSTIGLGFLSQFANRSKPEVRPDDKIEALIGALFLIFFLLMAGAFFSGRRHDVRYEGGKREVFVEGNWMELSEPQFNKCLLRNCRRDMAMLDFSLLVGVASVASQIRLYVSRTKNSSFEERQRWSSIE